MKKQILSIIYQAFEEWSADNNWACRKGCATCCSQNVTITALEGEQILDYALKENMGQWLAEKLSRKSKVQRPEQTINTFARKCLEGKEVENDVSPSSTAPCPFLEKNVCMIYPVRPFSCRCFLSLHTCSPEKPAMVSEEHLAASTAVNQLLEHLGQREYWGNMLDVLPAMLDISRYRSIADSLQDRSLVGSAKFNTLTALPLPGFLLGPAEYEATAPLLEKIFTQRVEGKTVEDILNGK